jgi:phosphonoacetaldehyde hydrolase
MEFQYHRSYRGHLKAAILDWAGTTLDFGCMAPAVVFMEVFERQNVPISIEEARIPMGAHKKVHIRKISQLPSVAGRWEKVHGKPCAENDVERMFEAFVPLQMACLTDYAELIPGTLDTVHAMRARGLKIGSTTGYLPEMNALLLKEAQAQGYTPDTTVCPADVPAGRPYPFMCLKNAIALEISPVAACVKIDDTLPGVEEGLNAGMWTIGLAVSGNEVGLPLEVYRALASEHRERLRKRAYDRMAKAGAHFVVDTIADVLPCLDAIELEMSRGGHP